MKQEVAPPKKKSKKHALLESGVRENEESGEKSSSLGKCDEWYTVKYQKKRIIKCGVTKCRWSFDEGHFQRSKSDSVWRRVCKRNGREVYLVIE